MYFFINQNIVQERKLLSFFVLVMNSFSKPDAIRLAFSIGLRYQNNGIEMQVNYNFGDTSFDEGL